MDCGHAGHGTAIKVQRFINHHNCAFALLRPAQHHKSLVILKESYYRGRRAQWRETPGTTLYRLDSLELGVWSHQSKETKTPVTKESQAVFQRG